MFKRLLSKIFSPLAGSQGGAATPSAEAQTGDSGDILYSLPTLCGPGPAIEDTPLPAEYRWLEEDAWRQVEFVDRKNLPHIERELAKLLAFKQEHQHGPGWTDIYTRAEHPAPIAASGLHITSLPAFSTSALVVGDGPPWGGTVRGGFALADGGDWFIDGQRTDDGGVIQLAVSPGNSVPSGQMVRALSEITRSSNLLLVDWLAGVLVNTSSFESVLTWARQIGTPVPVSVKVRPW